MNNVLRLPVAPMPALLAGLAQTTEQHRHLVSRALRESLPLQPIDYRGFETKVFRLSPTLRSRVTAIAEEHFGGDLKAAFAALSAAGIAKEVAEAQERVDRASASPVALPFEPKSDLQIQFFRHATRALEGSIVFAEGSTGIGKGRVLAAIALIAARTVDGLVVVAAPTVITMEQLYAEALTLPHDDLKLTILPGASEFVDDVLLTAFLEDSTDESLTPIREWVEAGAKPLSPNRPLVHSIGKDAAWLKSDLIQLLEKSELDADSFTLRDDLDSDSLSRAIVHGIRTSAKTQSDVVFCTHAMLALAQKTQWRHMPGPAFLVVDEAHQFEEAVGQMNSSKISMHTLRSLLARTRREHKLSARTAVAQAHAKVIELSKYLILLNQENTIDLDKLDPLIRRNLTAKCADVHTALSSPSCSAVPMVRSFARGFAAVLNRLNALNSPSSAAQTNGAHVSFSNVRRYPSFTAGPSSVGVQLAHIWSTAEHGVLLASATLYTPSATADLRCEYLRTNLNTPQARTVLVAPVIDPAIYEIPTMHLPKASTASMLRPGSYAAQADIIAKQVLPASAGGTLVLCTSYADIEGLSTALQTHSLDRELIVMERAMGFTACRRAFLQSHASGDRPILLALGPAWTGVDFSLPSIPADKDSLLTALVISKMPVGLNDTNTMKARFARMGMLAISHEALLLFKQGLGRLVRRAGVQGRHIWVLDGRLFDGKPWSDKSNMTEMTAAARRLLKTYRHVQEF